MKKCEILGTRYFFYTSSIVRVFGEYLASTRIIFQQYLNDTATLSLKARVLKINKEVLDGYMPISVDDLRKVYK